MGTDGTGPIFDEAEHWVALGAFTPAETTRIVLDTGRRLFPERRIGCLQPGCEADFLVLGADPNRDVRNLRAIRTAVKAGQKILPRTP
jgi:imidazolonepropionase-like amidohydrolase